MNRTPILVALALVSLIGCTPRQAGQVAVGVAAAAVAAGVNAAANAPPRSKTPTVDRSAEQKAQQQAEADAKLRAAQERRGDFFHGDDAFP